MTTNQFDNMKHRWESPRIIDVETTPWLLVLDEQKSISKLLRLAKVDCEMKSYKTGDSIIVNQKVYKFLSGGTKKQIDEAKKSIQITVRVNTRARVQIETPNFSLTPAGARKKRNKKRARSPSLETNVSRARICSIETDSEISQSSASQASTYEPLDSINSSSTSPVRSLSINQQPSTPLGSREDTNSPRHLFSVNLGPLPDQPSNHQTLSSPQNLLPDNFRSKLDFVHLFKCATALINENLNFDDFIKNASNVFIYSLQSLASLRLKAIKGTHPIDPLTSKTPWDFTPSNINIYTHTTGLYEFHLFKLDGMQPLDAGEQKKTIAASIAVPDEHTNICNLVDCCESNRYRGSKQDVKYHIQNFQYAFVCCMCGLILRDFDTLYKHCREACKGAETAGKISIKRKTPKIIVDDDGDVYDNDDDDADDGDDGDADDNDGDDGNKENTNLAKAIAAEVSSSLNPFQPSLESKIIMAATALTLADITCSEPTITIPELSNFPCYFISKNKRFVIYNLGKKKNVKYLYYNQALSAFTAEESKFTCNYTDCLHCDGQKKNFAAKEEKEMIFHIHSQFRLGCPKCKTLFTSLMNLDKHYTEKCLDNIQMIESAIMKQRKKTKYQNREQNQQQKE